MRNLNRIFILAALALVVTGFVLLNAPARGADDIVIGVATSLNTIEGQRKSESGRPGRGGNQPKGRNPDPT